MMPGNNLSTQITNESGFVPELSPQHRVRVQVMTVHTVRQQTSRRQCIWPVMGDLYFALLDFAGTATCRDGAVSRHNPGFQR